MGPDFKLFPGFFVHMRRTQNRLLVYAGGQRNGSDNLCTGPADRMHDFSDCLIQEFVVVCLEAYFNFWIHGVSLYFTTSVTTPEPMVLPPSRIAKRTSFSSAIGVINSTTRPILSPGITISTLSGRFKTPVTSVVRK